MKVMYFKEKSTIEAVQKFARKNYKTYVAHYKSRKLIPMSLDEFLKNYVS